MPKIDKTVIQDWRNIALQEVVFAPKMNCIFGGNGEGKTNLLDAVYALAMTKSAFQTPEKYNCRRGCTSYAISGACSDEKGAGVRYTLKCSLEDGKKFLKDGKAYTRLSDHIGEIPIVMVSPGDSALISDSSESRRRLYNSSISQIDREYLDALQRYNKLLAGRNALLRDAQGTDELIEAFDGKLSEKAAVVFNAREQFTSELSPLLQDYYKAISSGKEQVGIRYRSDLHRAPLQELLARGAERDRSLGYTAAGVQRDEIVFTLDGDPIRRVGSQGQQKSFLIALKFALCALLRKGSGMAPILLLDDLFDKLDSTRTAKVLEMVKGEDFGQIFISDTERSRVENCLSGDAAFIKAEGGVFTAQ